MKPIEITHTKDESRIDGGGSMLVIARTPDAKIEVLQHFRETERLSDALRHDDPLALLRLGSEKRPYFRCTGVVGERFTDPYYSKLKEMTGRDMRYEDIDSDTLMAFYPDYGLRHTHYAIGTKVSSGLLDYDFVVASSDWNGKSAAENASARALECAQESLGERPVVREFIEISQGVYRRNPKYGNRFPIEPCVAYQNWFMKALCAVWSERHATPGQLEAIDRNRKVMAEARCNGELWSLKNLRRDWTSPEISWEEFQAL